MKRATLILTLVSLLCATGAQATPGFSSPKIYQIKGSNPIFFHFKGHRIPQTAMINVFANNMSCVARGGYGYFGCGIGIGHNAIGKHIKFGIHYQGTRKFFRAKVKEILPA